METISMGTVYFDGKPQEVGAKAGKKTELSIGSTVPGKEIPWVRLKSGLLVAQKCVCVNVNWDKLDELGLVFGAVIQVNGENYLCRCLKVGNVPKEPNEWDIALAETTRSTALWHWRDVFFWGQEAPPDHPESRVLRGCFSADNWNRYLPNTTGEDIGFRPVLEPLSTASRLSKSMLGKQVVVTGPRASFISGKLVDFSDYDIIMEEATPIGKSCNWALKKEKAIIISRDNIIRLEEVENGDEKAPSR